MFGVKLLKNVHLSFQRNLCFPISCLPFSITFHFPPNVEKTLLICLISIVWLSICDPHQMVAAGTVLVKSRGATQSIYQSRNTWDFSKQQRKGSGWSQIETHVIKKDWERKIWVVGLWETNFTKSAHFFVSQEQKILSLLILQKVFYWLKWPKLHPKNVGTFSSIFKGKDQVQ